MLFVLGAFLNLHGQHDNVVFILTDDQDIEFGGLTPMKKTHKLLVETGVQFSHFYVATPICCPSRAQILSGRFAHNLRDDHFQPFPTGKGGSPALSCGDEPVEDPNCGKCGCMRMNCTADTWEQGTFINFVKRAGYATAYFGKFLNPPAIATYCRNETFGPLLDGWPSGWDIFYGMCDQASTPEGGYYDMNWIDSEAGQITFTGREPGNYTTSIVGNKTVAFIRQRAARGARAGAEVQMQPFFVVAAVRAPHAPYLPAVWYADALPGTAVDRTDPAYNASCEGKPSWMRTLNPPLTMAEAAEFDKSYGDRWRALLSVDDLVSVEGVVDALDEGKLLDSTWIFYTSDHGYHFGHFRLPPAKMHVYEFDVRVPFIVRGPRLHRSLRNTTLPHLAGNVDLAPTFLDIAGVGSGGGSGGAGGCAGNNGNHANPSAVLGADGRTLLPLLMGQGAGAGVEVGAGVEAGEGEGEEGEDERTLSGTHAPSAASATNPNRTLAVVPWRQWYIIEYYPIANWRPKAFRVDDCPNNTYRALRVVNATHDLLYSETTTLTDWHFGAVASRELYDMKSDHRQLRNVYADAGAGVQGELGDALARAFACRGAVECSSA